MYDLVPLYSNPCATIKLSENYIMLSFSLSHLFHPIHAIDERNFLIPVKNSPHSQGPPLQPPTPEETKKTKLAEKMQDIYFHLAHLHNIAETKILFVQVLMVICPNQNTFAYN